MSTNAPDAESGASTRAPAAPAAVLGEAGALETSTGAVAMRIVRIAITLTIFACFFVASGVLCLCCLPRLLLGGADRLAQARHRRSLNRGMARFVALLRFLHLMHFHLPALPTDLPKGGYLLVANHPSLLDIGLLFGACPDAVCVVKASWYRSPLMGPLLRMCDYVPGPGCVDDLGAATPVLERIQKKLDEGVPVLVFPEGTRSPYRGLGRFHRGSIEAAVRAKVPIVPVFLDTDRPFLMRGQRPWHVPAATPRFTFEWLGTVQTSGGHDSREITGKLVSLYRDRLAHLLEES